MPKINPVLYCAAPGFGTSNKLFLPGPIDTLTIGDEWDFTSHSVPAKKGRSHYGHALKPGQILVGGILRIKEGNAIDLTNNEIDELDMFTEWHTLRDNLDKITRTTPAEFFVFYDTGTPLYRKYKDIYQASITLEMGEQFARSGFQYTITLERGEDTVLYTTAPGS